jgi:hypothetical protein
MKNDTIILHAHTGLGDHLVISGLVRSFFIDRYKTIYVVTNPENISTLSHLYEDLPQIKFLAVNLGDDWGHSHVYNLSLQLDCPIFKLGFKWHWLANIGITAFPGDPDRYIKYAGGKNSIFNNKKEYMYPEEGYEYPRKFYTYLDQPYENRYKYFKLPAMRERAYQLYDQLYPNEKYVLVHSVASNWKFTNLNIDTKYKKVYVEPLTDSLLDWVPLIQHAEEIHCVDSAVLHLADNLSHSLRAKLYYHDARNYGGIRVEYPENNFVWTKLPYSEKFPP